MTGTARAGDVALVHDYLLVMRGAERTFAELAALWPGAPIHTLLHDPGPTADRLRGHVVVAGGLQRLGVRQAHFRALLPLFPAAVERLHVGDARLVVSSSSAWAHGVRPHPDAVHVCYCHSPFRYAWFQRDQALAELPPVLRPAVGAVLARTRRWDLEASTRVTHYVANSEITRRRIAEIYGRESTVVHPPVQVERFAGAVTAPEDWLLIVCELVRHKRVDEALQAARRAGRRVRVVGTGPELERLRAEHADHAEFLGRVDDRTLDDLYPRALAFVMPNVEEFGIAAVEAQAAGRPVVALRAGGAQETVRDGVTGVLVDPDAPDDLPEALRAHDFTRFDPVAARANAERFSAAAFRANLAAEVARAAPGLAPAGTATAVSA